jgi:hypothetical protein
MTTRTGMSPAATIARAGAAASAHSDSDVRSHTAIARVSSPSGRRRRVAGISFIVSTFLPPEFE